MTVSPDPSVALLEGKLRELSATVVELQCNCQDYRRLAYDADLRVRAHVSQVERSLREALREEAGKLHTNLEAMGEALAQEQTKRTQQLEQLAGELGELVQGDLRESGDRLRVCVCVCVCRTLSTPSHFLIQN